jgi:outer membrane lipoprotein-sorting protein
LLTDALQPTTQSLSGTVTTKADLGLPSLSGITGAVTGTGVVPGGAASVATGSTTTPPALGGLTALLSGTSTLRVWADGPDRSRVAVIANGGESDVVHNGTDLWVWQSAGKQVLHATLPARSAADARSQLTPDQSQRLQKALSQLPTTPQQAAQMILANVGTTTDVTTGTTASIAGRAAYELVATPKDQGSLVAKVVVAIDAQTHVPLRTDVYSTRLSGPALTVGFTDVSFTAPPASAFAFTPPAGATVQQWQPPTTKPDTSGTDTKPQVSTSGTGWATVVVAHLPAGAISGQAGGPLTLFPTVSGAWGSGHALAGTLFSVLVTDTGTVAAGAVPVATLEAAVTGTGQ